jgi:hypothetical protein
MLILEFFYGFSFYYFPETDLQQPWFFLSQFATVLPDFLQHDSPLEHFFSEAHFVLSELHFFSEAHLVLLELHFFSEEHFVLHFFVLFAFVSVFLAQHFLAQSFVVTSTLLVSLLFSVV